MKGIKFITILSILVCLLIVIPTAFAVENETDVGIMDDAILASADDDILVDNDIYFDVNNPNEGNGSLDNPYKNFNNDKIKTDSVVHLANGEYNLTKDGTYSNISFYGESSQNTVLNGNGFKLTNTDYLSFKNITLKNFNIINNKLSILEASDTVFRDFASPNEYGVIYSSSTCNVILTDCMFYNNTAVYGAAIKMDSGSIELYNTTFIGNSARYGGAVYARDAGIEIYNSTFKNNIALLYGGAICSISTYVEGNNSSFSNNRAGIEGGAIYLLYGGEFNFANSTFNNNSANMGGALFVDAMNNVIIVDNSFENNNASIAGAIYSLANSLSVIENNTYINNSADEYNDLLNSTIPYLFIGDGNVLFLTYNSSFTGELPDRYDLRDYGYVTPVKNQGSGGNCWAFATLAALESCILKAAGGGYDLSEENMKNLMALYSDYGWNMQPNDGGYDNMGVGYLIGWLGPVNESEDKYNPKSILSPILSGLMHVQNVVYLTRSNYTDNDAIKKAILDYGGVFTSIAWKGTYKNNARYYDGTSNPDHAVTIIGWDDNYSKDNFAITPPGDGAWIIKNSHGVNSGDGGYWYVSYYDVSTAKVGKTDTTFTFILNDTIKYDKNYQYDIPGKTDYFLNSSSTVWYKNVFNATDKEYLAAVSTFFADDTNYTISVLVNNVVKLTQSGFAREGYYTFDLNEMIPLEIGDIFEVIFKITAESEARFPISEKISLNKYFYKENISFLSYDGENWTDLYELEWAYPGHTYASQVACIKAFTVFDEINTTTKLEFLNYTDAFNVEATVLNQYSRPVNNGNVTFTIDNRNYIVNVKNGKASLSFNLTFGKYNISATYNPVCGYISSQDTIELNFYPVATAVNVTVIGEHNPILFLANITDENGLSIDGGNFTFIVEGESYTCNVTNGMANLTHEFKTFGLKDVEVIFNGLYRCEGLNVMYYTPSNAMKSFDVKLIGTNVTLTVLNDLNPYEIVAVVNDEFGNVIESGNVIFNVEGQNYTVDIVNGSSKFNYSFKTPGNNTVIAYFEKLGYYNSTSNVTKYVTLKTSISISVLNDCNPYEIVALVYDEFGSVIESGVVIINVEGQNQTVGIVGGSSRLNYTFSNYGNAEVIAYFAKDGYVDSTSNVTKFIVLNSSISLSVLNDRNPYEIIAIVTDEFDNVINSGEVIINAEGQNYTSEIINGQSNLTHVFKDYGNANVIAYFAKEGYISSTSNVTKFIVLNSSISLSVLNDCNPYEIVAVVYDEFGNVINSGEVIINIEGQNQTVEIVNGSSKVTHVFENYGNKTIRAYFAKDGYFSSSSNVTKFTVVKSSVALTVLNNYNPYEIVAVVSDEFGNVIDSGFVIFNADGENHTEEIANGSSKLNYSFRNYGNNTVIAYFTKEGYVDYTSNVTKYVYIDKVDIGLNITKYDYFNVIIEIYLSKEANEMANVTVNGSSHDVELRNGFGQLTLTDLVYGNYSVEASIDSDRYYSESVENSFAINNLRTYIVANGIELYYDGNSTFNAYLYDSFNRPLSDKNLTFSFDNMEVNATTDSNGKASVPITYLPGNYSVNIIFNGEGEYLKSNASENIIIKSTVTLPGNDKYTYNSQYVVVLVDGNGNPLSDQLVTFKINSVVKTLRTDSNGNLKFTVNLSPGKYTFEVTNPSNQEVKTQSVTVAKRITQNKDITMYYGAGKYFKVRVFDDYGNIAKGVKVTFKINGKTYSRTSNSNGYASFKINLKPKTYKITAEYKGYKVSNKIVVKTTLITKNIKVKKGKTIKFKAKLLNSKGKILKNKKITFKFKGKTYKAKTNSKGIATLKIANKYKVGKYTITSRYGKLTVKNTIQIKR